MTVTCPGSNPVNVPNGVNGAPCTVAATDGGVNVNCPGNSPVFIANGSNGTNGNNGAPGLGLSEGLKIQIVSVTSPATAPVSVRFKVQDNRGNPVDLLGNYSINTLMAPRFALSYHEFTNGVVSAYKVYSGSGSKVAATTTDPAPDPATVAITPSTFTPTWPIPTTGVPATDVQQKGLLVENGTGFGDYTYTFPTGGNTQIRATSGTNNGKMVTTVYGSGIVNSAKTNATHTLWIQIARQTDINNVNNLQTFTPLDYEYNFIPSGTGTPVAREVASQTGCDKCHNGFKRDVNPNETLPTPGGFHGGGRVEVAFCNVCHNPDRTSNPAADSDVFVHRIHAGHLLTANPDGGVPVNAFHGLMATYPQDNRNCAACHEGALQGAQATSVMNRQVCGSCHDNVKFVPDGGAPSCDEAGPAVKDADGRFVPCEHTLQADDTNCALCHGPTGSKPAAAAHVAVVPPAENATQLVSGSIYGGTYTTVLPDGGVPSANQHASFMAGANMAPAGAKVITYDLKEILVTGGKLQAVFKLKMSVNGAAATDVVFNPNTDTELINGFVGSPTVYFAWSVPQDGIAAPADFNASASCYLRNAWKGVTGSSASICSLSGPDSSGYYTVQMTNVVLQTGSTMLTGGLGYAYNITSARPLTQIDLAAYPYSATTGLGGLSVPAPNKWKVATGYTARRPIVESARCNNCHVQLGVAPSYHAGQRNDGPTCSFCHNPNRTSSGWSANSKDFLHSIHGARIRTVAFNWHALSEDQNFGEIEYPSNTNNCQACHAAGTYDFTLPSTVAAYPNMLFSTVATGKYDGSATTNPNGWFSLSPYVVKDNVYDYGANTAVTTTGTPAVTAAAATTLVKSPITAACSACHDAKATIAHMQQMGGMFYEPRGANFATQGPPKTEQCLICHGPGTLAPITNMHK